LLCLPVLAQSARPSVTPYAAQFSNLVSQFERAHSDSYRAVLLNRAFDLRIYLTDRAALAAWLESIRLAAGSSQPLRAEAARLLREIARAEGKTALPPLPPSPLLLPPPEQRPEPPLLVASEAAEPALGSSTPAGVASALAGNPALIPANATSAFVVDPAGFELEALHAAGALQLAARQPEAQTTLERYANQANSAEAWVEFSRACANQLCRFSALQRALKLEPANREALWQQVDYYRERGQSERQRQLLKGIFAAFPSDFVARKFLADLLFDDGQEQAALEQFERLERDFPTVLWVKREAAAAYERLGLLRRAMPLAAEAFAGNRTGGVEQALLIRLAAATHDVPRLRSAYEAIGQLYPADGPAIARLALLRWRAGEVQAAREMVRRALARDPANPDLLSAATQLQAGSCQNPVDHAPLRAATIAPGWQEPIDCHRLLPDADAEFLAVPEQIVAQAGESQKGGGQGPREQAAVLSYIRIDRVAENGLATTRVQQFWRVGGALAAPELSNRKIQYSPETQALEILTARLHKKDGRVLEAEDTGESAVADSRVAMYYDQRSREIHFPGSEPGDVIELDYRTSPLLSSNPYGDYFASLNVFRESLPVMHQRYVLIAPAARQPYIVEERMAAPAAVRQAGNQRIYQWDERNLPAWRAEPHGPALTDSAAYVHVSWLGDWQQFGRWYAGLLNPQLVPDEPLRAVAARIAAEHADELDRIRAVHQFVWRNTRYVAFEFGVHSYKPYPVSQVYARRFGDCKDKSGMIIALLRQMGIDAQFALVRTRSLGGFAPQAASAALFNHAIVYIPKYDIWVDGTADLTEFGEVPLADQGAIALTVAQDGAARLRQVPLSTAEQNSEADAIRADILADGTIRFSGTAIARGENAPALRRQLRESGAQRESLRKTYAEVFPTIRVDDVRVQGPKNQKGVVIEFQGSVDAVAGRRRLLLPAAWSRPNYVQELAGLPQRTQELVFTAPWERTQEIKIWLPANARVLAAPAARQRATRFAELTLEYQQHGRELTLRSTVRLNATRVPPSEYAEFRGFWDEVDRALRQQVKVELQ
jgi:transglutaminase-like putative cysteine protease